VNCFVIDDEQMEETEPVVYVDESDEVESKSSFLGKLSSFA